MKKLTEFEQYRKGYKQGYSVANRKNKAMIKMVAMTIKSQLENVIKMMDQE